MKLDLNTQNTILKKSIDTGVKLEDVLSDNGLTYEDLRYNDSFIEKKHISHPSMITLDNIVPLDPVIPAVSFFSGAGGLDIGFRYAGFNNVVSIEHTELFCNTLRFNNPDKFIIGPPEYRGDISDKATIAQILRANNIERPFNGVFHGGPPCQSFSIAASQRFNKNGENFKRKGFDDIEKGMLLFDYIWFIKEFRPLAFLIENVAGITEFDSDNRIGNALDDLRNIGYTIQEPKIFDTAFYDVPQHRKRWIVLGIRGEVPIDYPQPAKEPLCCEEVFNKTLDHIENHVTRMHKAESVMRYACLMPGGRDRLGRVDRLDPGKPSKTVIAGGVKGGGRSHLHPYIPRTISVRECARLQTFPDNYVFTGTTARQFTQVGNAVPPMFAYKLALAIKRGLIANGYFPPL